MVAATALLVSCLALMLLLLVVQATAALKAGHAVGRERFSAGQLGLALDERAGRLA